MIIVSLAVKNRQNKSPFAIALGDWFLLRTYVLTSKASPNDSKIVIIVIIIVIGEAKLVLHIGGIIAQTVHLNRGAAGLRIMLLGATSGVVRANWWIALVVYAILGIAYAYLVFLQPRRLSQG